MDFLTIFLNIIEPLNILMMACGLTFGIIVGALPGLGILLAMSVLIPFTFGLPSLAGVFLLLGAYCGSSFGGSISAILINSPGTPNALCTTYDGYPMAQQGKANIALNAAVYGSTIGGILSCIALIFFAPLIASVAIKFGPADFFSICLFGVIIVVSTGEDFCKGLITAGIGFLLSSVGMDSIDGTSRFQFGRIELMSGINIVCIALGTFALAEVMLKSYKQVKQVNDEDVIKIDAGKFSLIDALKHWKTMFISSVLGIFIGAVPGTGGSLAAYLSYDIAKSTSDDPDSFGKGNVVGVIAPESANNATTGATLIPLLTLGIPGDAAVAILLGALMMQGITPGIDLFTKDKTWVYTIMIGLILVNVLMCVIGKLAIKGFVKTTKISPTVLIPCILVFVLAGAFSIRSYTFDIILVILIGMVGYVLRRFDYSVAPLTIGLVLGTLCEFNMRRALLQSSGDISIFFQRPISLVALIMCAIVAILPVIRYGIKMKKSKTVQD